MISRTKYTKNVLVGSPAAFVRDEIHCNKYPGTHRVMNVGYPGTHRVMNVGYPFQPYKEVIKTTTTVSVFLSNVAKLVPNQEMCVKLQVDTCSH